MKTFTAFLRGINVGGKNKILMSNLSEIFRQLKFEKVATYIQSGNIVFNCQTDDIENLQILIEQAILKNSGLTVPAIIRSVEQLKMIVGKVPFLRTENVNVEQLYVTFLKQTPDEQNISKLNQMVYKDSFEIFGNDIFVHCKNGYGKTDLTNTLFENKLKVAATTRNWKTINAIISLVQKQSD